MREGMVLGHQFRLVRGNASPEDAISAGSYPASGSFIDVSNVRRVHCLIELGAINALDAPVFTIQAASANNGTLATVDATNLAITLAGSDDDKFVSFSFPVSLLPTDSHFVTVTASGTLANGTQASIVWFLEDAETPVTQAAFVTGGIKYAA